ncbi:3345_t:CDS:1, partial [Acaulospora colombiana]
MYWQFINMASGSHLKVSTGLRSCTMDVTATDPFLVKDQKVVLLDTPGFDNTNASDFDILEEIARYMTKTYVSSSLLISSANREIRYKKRRLLDGILYFHNIVDNVMGAKAQRNLRVFQSLCGNESLKAVVVVTNMWGLIPNMDLGVAREKELAEDPVFFGQLLRNGAGLRRHTGTRESSHEILSSLLFKGDKQEVLNIQTEIVDRKLLLEQTSAAVELIKEFDSIIRNLVCPVRLFFDHRRQKLDWLPQAR